MSTESMTPEGAAAILATEQSVLLKDLREDYGDDWKESYYNDVIADYEKQRHEAADRIEALEAALREIAEMRPEPIGDSGFATGPKAHFDACQRIARAALKD